MTEEQAHLEIQRAVGQLEGRLSAVEQDIKEIARDIKKISAAINNAKGGWRTFSVIFGVTGTAAAAGAGLVKLIEHWK